MKCGRPCALALFLFATCSPAGAQTVDAPVRALKVTVLSTMLAGNAGEGIGEWGFAALVEADGRRWLMDTGARPETVLRNAAELGVDLSSVTDVVMTHNHGDHTAGLITLRREFARRNPAALSRVHVAQGMFVSRLDADGRERNGLLPFKAPYEALGGTFVEHSGPARLAPGVWLTGPVPRLHPERNWSVGSQRLQTAAGPVEDTVPEDSSMVVASSSGLILISGCGHAGIINTLELARKVVKDARVHAAIGGFHLFAATDDALTWTATKLREFELGYLLGAHCTGIEAVFRIRQVVGLPRQRAAVGAVGSSFTLGSGLDPRQLAQ
jgi:7,8-dihydropterin-6-yl-methyl-4-(beta-D-ribofuranosyl)aminobenzene 5'-phosphate synthase